MNEETGSDETNQPHYLVPSISFVCITCPGALSVEQFPAGRLAA